MKIYLVIPISVESGEIMPFYLLSFTNREAAIDYGYLLRDLSRIRFEIAEIEIGANGTSNSKLIK